MLPLLLAGQLMLYTLLRLIGPVRCLSLSLHCVKSAPHPSIHPSIQVHSGTTQAVLRSLPGNIALLLALVFLVPGALTLL